MRKRDYLLTGLLGGFILLVALVFLVSPIRERMLNKLGEWRVQVFYALNPPQQAVFVPEDQQNQVAEIVQKTMEAIATARVTPTPTLDPSTPTPGITPTPTITATPLPAAVSLDGIKYQSQHGLWNYCAPTTLAMALSYWGVQVDRQTVGKVVKPFDKDKNVMAYELADYVTGETNLSAVVRYGGTLDVLKRLIANKYVVLVEKGIIIKDDITHKLGWVGHYDVVSGYDDARQVFITQDAYYSADYEVSYADMQQEWLSFNYLFMVIYPPDQEADLMAVLGDYADETSADQIALQTASTDTGTKKGADLFFAYFNRGTSLVELQDYVGASRAYDQAFSIEASLAEADRPWRVTWYETGPYYAYYYSGRYQDVINLATTTIDTAAEPYLEESFVWRARARVALGETGGAIDDVKQSLVYHPGFGPSLALAQSLGITP